MFADFQLRAWVAAALGAGLASAAPNPTTARPFFEQHCFVCHNSSLKTAGLALDAVPLDEPGRRSEVWEQVVRRLRARQMPPAGLPRPSEEEYERAVGTLEAALDEAYRRAPDPGRVETFRRLTRLEYRNAVRDLTALDLDVSELLPADESSYGFDNITVGELSPMLLERYVAAAEKISRLAVGRPGRAPDGVTHRLPPDRSQETHVAGLPLGMRGGAAVSHVFPADGEYEIRARLTRDRDEHVEGLTEPHELEILVDGRPLQRFTIEPPTSADHSRLDERLFVRAPIQAGPREVAATFVKKPRLLIETARQPYEARFNYYRHPRVQPALYSLTILGPYEASVAEETPSRRRLFVCRPAGPSEDDECARRIVAKLTRRAYRRPVTDEDLRGPLEFYRRASAEGGFEAGVERTLAAVLVSPEFLFRVERDPPGLASGEVYAVSDLELASRLSFFLWSSLPDEELLATAERGELGRPAELERQTRRLLADPRAARNLAGNFAAQWLHLRNLAATTPDMRRFPDFDDNLRQAMRRETELLVESVVQDDRSVLDLLRADYTFLDERLAKHYGIPRVYGSRFRRVSLEGTGRLGGLLGQGAILTATSYATRTSPVIRGKWVLDNLLGIPPPPPPPDVPALKENKLAENLSVRERLAAHRADPVCAGCHQLMDPIGLALEQYDAVGRFRTREAGRPIDASGGFPDGRRFDGVEGLREALLSRPEIFTGVLAEKLLTFAIGRGVEHHDAPAVREIVRRARADDYRFSTLVLGIVESAPFRMRKSK